MPTRAVGRAYPNPSAGQVRFALPALDGNGTTWGVFDVSGRLRARLTEDAWDGTDETGRTISPGIYFVRPVGRQGGPTITLVRR